MLKKFLIMSAFLVITVAVIACDNERNDRDDRVEVAAAQVAQAEAEATAAAAGAAQVKAEATAVVVKVAQENAEATAAAAEAALTEAEALVATAETSQMNAEATSAAALATAATITESNDCLSGDTSVQLGLVMEELDDALESQTIISLFQDGKEITAGNPINGLYSLNLRPGLYTVQVQYGNPQMKYQEDICLSEEGSLIPIKLPYSKFTILVQTIEGLTPFRPYTSLTLLPTQIKSNNMQPKQVGRRNEYVLNLNVLEGQYNVELTYANISNETQTELQTVDLQANQPLTVTFNSLPEDGNLIIEASFDPTLSGQDGYQASVTIVDNLGTQINNNIRVSPASNLLGQATLPLIVGRYDLIVAYMKDTTTIHQLEIPIEIESGKITFVQFNDIPDSAPTIEVKESE